MRLSLKIIFIITSLFLTNHFAQAASTEWQNCPGGQTRVIIKKEHNNTNDYIGVIQIELKDGWKSFWQNPGNIGVAPQLTFKLNNQKYQPQIFYPTPVFYKNNNQWAYVYHGNINLPFKLKLNTSALTNNDKLLLSASIGFCQNMCIPLMFDLSLNKQEIDKSNLVEQVLINDAFAKIPTKASENFAKILVKKNNEICINITAPNPSNKTSELFIGSDQMQLTPPRLIKATDKQTIFSSKILGSQRAQSSIYYIYTNGKQSWRGNLQI